MAIIVPTFEASKTDLVRVDEQTRDTVMGTPHGMFNYLREHNPDHILVSGKRANQAGVVLYGFEHLGRDCQAVFLADQLGLQERQVFNAVGRINPIIHAVFGFKIERPKGEFGYTGVLRITTADDALQASEAYCKKLKKMHTEYVQTMSSYQNNGGDVLSLLRQAEGGEQLLSMFREVGAPALAAAAADTATL